MSSTTIQFPAWRETASVLRRKTSPRLVFQHIPKTAGTSLHSELSTMFQADEICPERGDFLDRLDPKKLFEYRFFSGHFDKHNIDLIPTPKFVVTFLREPRQRILSLYYYLKSYRMDYITSQGLEGHRLAKTLPLLQFLRCDDPNVLAHIDNGLTRSIIGQQRAEKFERLNEAYADVYADWALCNLRRYNFVGFVESFSADMVALRSFLNLPPAESPRLNSFNTIMAEEAEIREPVATEPLTPDVYHALQDLTSVDSLLHRRAFEQRDDLRCPYPW